jgi:hypothetical protein
VPRLALGSALRGEVAGNGAQKATNQCGHNVLSPLPGARLIVDDADDGGYAQNHDEQDNDKLETEAAKIIVLPALFQLMLEFRLILLPFVSRGGGFDLPLPILKRSSLIPA